MPLALIIIGVVLLDAGFRGSYSQLGHQLQNDFTGQGNFLYWIAALGVIGAIGYIPGLEKFSKAFLALIIIGIFVSNKGVFAQFNSAISSAQPVEDNFAAEDANQTEIPQFAPSNYQPAEGMGGSALGGLGGLAGFLGGIF